MPDTPDNNLEQQLRDYAEQRRDAAGTPAMHPATRRLLQAEVKEQLADGAAASAAPAEGRFRFWPRLAFALGIIVMLCVVAVLLGPPGGKPKADFELAKLQTTNAVAPTRRELVEPLRATAPASDSLRPTVATPAPSGSMAEKDTLARSRMADATATTEVMLSAKSAPARDIRKFKAGPEKSPSGQPVVAPGAASGLVDQTKTGSREESFAAQPKAMTIAKAAAPAKGGFSSADKELKAPAPSVAMKLGAPGEAQLNTLANVQTISGRADLGQRYRNVVAGEKRASEAALPVLDEFTVNQTGDALTIVDRDGSVYSGFTRLAEPATRANVNYDAAGSGAMRLVENANTGGRGGQAFQQRSQNDANELNLNRAQSQSAAQNAYNLSAQNAPAQNATANYFFRVEGTNRSLNQRVVFSGNILQNGAVFNTYNNAGSIVTNSQVFQNVQPVPNASSQNIGQGFNFNNSQGLNNTYNVPVQNFINGRVQLDNRQAGELNAIPVDR